MEKKIQAELMSAMKEKNAEKTTAIREIKTAIMKFKTSAEYKGECTEADILGLIQKISKQHKESADMYAAAGREDLVKEELAQLEYINFFLPKMMSCSGIPYPMLPCRSHHTRRHRCPRS